MKAASEASSTATGGEKAGRSIGGGYRRSLAPNSRCAAPPSGSGAPRQLRQFVHLEPEQVELRVTWRRPRSHGLGGGRAQRPGTCGAGGCHAQKARGTGMGQRLGRGCWEPACCSCAHPRTARQAVREAHRRRMAEPCGEALR